MKSVYLNVSRCVLMLALSGFIGCGSGNNNPPLPDSTQSGSEPISKPQPPGVGSAGASLKPLPELQIPTGLAEPPTEAKIPRRGWDHLSHTRPGDYIELENPDSRLRIEAFDVADHGIVQVNEFTTKEEGVETKSKSATKLLYTEPDPDPSSEYYFKLEKKPSTRKFTVQGQEIVAETVTEMYSKDGKLLSKTWGSKQVPFGTLLMEDGEGQVTSRLIGFGRNRGK